MAGKNHIVPLLAFFAALVLAVPASGAVVAPSDAVSVFDPADESTWRVGDVVAQGTLGPLGCEMPEVRSRVVLDSPEDFSLVGLLVDPSCTMRVNLACSPETPCVSPPPIPVLHSTSEPDDGSAGTAASCGSVTSARSDTWTLGYGGPGDVLTKVEVTDYFNTGCSDGVARLGSYSGFCQWASWNGWQKNACYYGTNPYPPGWAAQGVIGTFECHNNNFCNTNHFVHSLFTEAESNNVGTVYCDHGQSGMVPPKTDGTSQTYYSCQPA